MSTKRIACPHDRSFGNVIGSEKQANVLDKQTNKNNATLGEQTVRCVCYYRGGST